MLQTQKSKAPVKAVLRVSMVIPGGDHGEKGDVVEFAAKDFFYLKQFDRVIEASKENVAAVLAEVEADAKHAAKLVKEAAENSVEALKAKIVALEAALAGKK